MTPAECARILVALAGLASCLSLANAVDCELRGFPSQDLAACVAKRNCTAPCVDGHYTGCAGYLHGWQRQPRCDLGGGGEGPVVVNEAVLATDAGNPNACRVWCTDVYLGAAPQVIEACEDGCQNARAVVEEREDRENVDPSPLESPLVIAGIAIGAIAIILVCVRCVKPKCQLYFLKRRIEKGRALRKAEEGQRAEGDGGGDGDEDGQGSGMPIMIMESQIKPKHGREQKKHRKKQKRIHRNDEQAQIDMALADYFQGALPSKTENTQTVFRDGELVRIEIESGQNQKAPRRLLDLEVRSNIERKAPSPELPTE